MLIFDTNFNIEKIFRPVANDIMNKVSTISFNNSLKSHHIEHIEIWNYYYNIFFCPSIYHQPVTMWK